MKHLPSLFAWLTLLSALPLISMGAVVTTVDAGMAFPDWPTSDGYSMLAYPWLQSFGEPDKFLEHGHRLAGMLTGFFALLLCGSVFVTKQKTSVRMLATLVLLLVIAQGILGGMRVSQVSKFLAMVHGNFACWVFTVMAIAVAVMSSKWTTVERLPGGTRTRAAVISTSLLCLVLFLQSLLGGMLRHLGAAHAWRDHPYFAFVVLGMAAITWVLVRRLHHPWLSSWVNLVLILVNLQFLIGLGTWLLRYGWPDAGLVAIQQTSALSALRSLHT
ncbi:MAG: hypothetical protein C0478_18445, partial [Planctomyces sp.]|nr:hypothetical protein [Planctomyces sp.]